MPRSGRGGKRQGTPGRAYPNRTDLAQAPTAAPGQTYGNVAQQINAQKQIPLPKQAPPAAPASAGSAPAGPPPPAGAAPAPIAPGSLGPLDAPTTRPGEPLTAGLTTGAGPGPEALGMAAQPDADPTVATLKGILARYPNADLQALVAQASARTP